jgi:DNA mismatch repair protein MutL
MQKIFQLPEHVISKIAAGEVIERPAYVVKELIENAIDAKADRIEVHIEESGMKRITVLDNGEGMSREDLELSFHPHTTSKIRSEDELIGIKSLGFRGEALASIAAVSTLLIQTRTTDAIGGTEIEVMNGSLQSISSTGMPIGSRISAEHLFASLPARKKFLKSPKTEYRHITEIVTNFALSYPTIHFLLTHNKKVMLDLPKKTLIERVEKLLGEHIMHHLLPITSDEGYIKIHGFIGKPQIAAKNNQKQYIFVNNRRITDRTISLAVREAYGTLLPTSFTPIFLIHINVPHEMVDVNIHPRKEQVAFINQKMIFDAVKDTINQTLTSHNITFNLVKFHRADTIRKGETSSYSGKLLKETVLSPEKVSNDELITNAPFIQMEKTYIFTVAKTGFLLIDQHAAHERILFQEFIKTFEEERNKSKTHILSTPVQLQLSINEMQILEEFIQIFKNMGFHIENFAGSTYLIRKIPSVFRGRNIQAIIVDMLSDLTDDMVGSIDLKTKRMLSFLACRAAVKSGDVLAKNQMKQLVKTLTSTENNTTCPHGRPTKIMISSEELQRWFQRK